LGAEKRNVAQFFVHAEMSAYTDTEQKEHMEQLEEVAEYAREVEYCRDMINELLDRMVTREMPIIRVEEFMRLAELCAPVARLCSSLIEDSIDPGY